MSGIEIAAGVLLALASIVIILVVLVQESKEQGLTSAIGGGYNDSFYGKNTGNTRDAKLNRLTRVCAIILFVVTLGVSIVHQIMAK
ncbi:preprotein translocase subunit SecG [uncultured Ruminococcus sp.]|uniref:preprotein translocase subunit SecG n=1 Tax=uncultured Ruminococcus sp. TaxID=165186 RepID=UPI0025DB8A25|nr:preprotein translocase subunit SecG [uncultured Ruminococcus sp.]